MARKARCRFEQTPLGTEGEGGDDATGVGDAAGGDDGEGDGVDDLGDEGEGAGEGILGGAEEGAAVAAGFEAGSDDQVDICLLQFDGFVGCGGGADEEDVFGAALVENFFGWDANDEAEDGDFGVDEDSHLVLEFYW